MYVPFENISEDSRVWVYQAARQLSAREKDLISSKLSVFCDGWNTHGNRMPTSFQILDDQILVLAVDESGLGASGCSIDSSVRTLRQLEEELGTNITDQGKVTFKSNSGEISVASALGIKSKVTSGEIDSQTLVINSQVKSKKDLESVWVLAGNSWLNRYFPN
ncbi:hypothetical protein LV84_00874 [Algoriphagus ratkowskyi]|uniref:ABC transporter ATPase n=1 Tax=Algoriphagus ratkowskyi TaxID=57028 RepID=A0A2W7RL23_9BACT|nr:hypothetical protein [Algoriphagus ratkowskyi]PZX59666.1 hypothetical protein LV84_00874 [Algoriphagus ratkowskyi]TXD78615.1 hypothetical protein ESW18_07440 [Algoriphagus ratkowskyi]